MKADTAVVTINGYSRLKVLLIPENDKELEFLKNALKTCEDFAVSASTGEIKNG